MRAALHGSINRTNWKKPKQRQRSFLTTAQESEHTQQDKRGRKNTLRPFLRIYRKGKRKHKHQRQDKRTTESERTKERTKKMKSRSKEQQMKARKIKIEANTQQAFNPPNSTRVQKPHKPRKPPRQYKHTRNPQNPLKTP